jgi:DNA-binding IclR family transcriptional regulator
VTASGQVMLAYQNDEERALMLAEHTKVKGEISLDANELAAMFATSRAEDHLRKDSVQTLSVTDVTFPILGPSGQAIASLTTPCTASTCTSRRRSMKSRRCWPCGGLSMHRAAGCGAVPLTSRRRAVRRMAIPGRSSS